MAASSKVKHRTYQEEANKPRDKLNLPTNEGYDGKKHQKEKFGL